MAHIILTGHKSPVLDTKDQIALAKKMACDTYGEYLNLTQLVRVEPVQATSRELDIAFDVWQKATNNYYSLLSIFEKNGWRSNY